MTRKLGKLAPKPHPKALKLSRYITGLPAPPAKVYREYKIPNQAWGMDANDKVGDCTCAAAAHMLMLVTSHTGTIVVPTTEQVLGLYSAVTGYDASQTLPDGSNPTDNGAAVSDVLEYWRTQGLAEHKILAWAQIDHKNLVQIKQAIWLFGAVDIGVNLPSSAMLQVQNNQPWDIVEPDGGNDGGHCIPLFGYGSDGTTSVTWGALQQMSWDWYLKYCDEAYAVITPDWFDQVTQKTPSGFDIATLQSDLTRLREG